MFTDLLGHRQWGSTKHRCNFIQQRNVPESTGGKNDSLRCAQPCNNLSRIDADHILKQRPETEFAVAVESWRHESTFDLYMLLDHVAKNQFVDEEPDLTVKYDPPTYAPEALHSEQDQIGERRPLQLRIGTLSYAFTRAIELALVELGTAVEEEDGRIRLLTEAEKDLSTES